LNPIPLTKIPNLYLAGQAVTAPGILGTMMSAFLACGYIVGHETLRKELRQCA
jgi:all-trans-retinol 13,14-reductase